MIAARLRVPAAVAAVAAANVAAAHEQAGVAGGLVSGFLHPITGVDHLIAMVGVGLWGAQLGQPAIWVLPITFPLVMAVGGVLGVIGVPLPVPEIVIALSALVLGAMVAAHLRVQFSVAAAIVAVFAIFHGHAHGAELPRAADPLAYGVGFVAATGMLHLCGILIGTLVHWRRGQWVIQALGGSIAMLGAYFLWVGLDRLP